MWQLITLDGCQLSKPATIYQRKRCMADILITLDMKTIVCNDFLCPRVKLLSSSLQIASKKSFMSNHPSSNSPCSYPCDSLRRPKLCAFVVGGVLRTLLYKADATLQRDCGYAIFVSIKSSSCQAHNGSKLQRRSLQSSWYLTGGHWLSVCFATIVSGFSRSSPR